MESNKVTDILKQAIIMENRGKSLYAKVAETTSSEEVRKIFDIMAKEEQMHIDFLSKQFANYKKSGKFDKLTLEEASGEDAIANLILSDKIKKDISGSGFEAAAISAAIDMETKSIEVYQARAKEAADPNEKELYQWLADWEKGHHKMLIDLNKELTEKVWYDNNFWPF
ncbi:MAG: ferritin family protein [Bacteroidales bacterium]|jgi:rubrerythrin|nr:ferritin family protein [Bacteroidales bacterium]NLM93343.1 ferritin family protein [Bacteroidales bacterium]